MRVVAAPDKFRGTATAAEVAAAVGRAAAGPGGTATRCRWPTAARARSTRSAGRTAPPTVTGPLGDPVAAGWRLAGTTRRHRDGPGVRPRAGRRRRGQRPDRGVDLRHRRADRAPRSTPGPGASSSASAARPRPTAASARCGRCTRCPACGASSSSSPATCAPASSTPPTCSRPQKGATRGAGRAAPPPARAPGPGVRGGARRRRPRRSTAPAPPAAWPAGWRPSGRRSSSGFELVADEVDLYDRIEGADLVVTGEGFLDEQSFEGKVVGGVAELAAEAGVPVRGDRRRGARRACGDRIDAVSLVERFGEERPWSRHVACIEEVVAELLSRGQSGLRLTTQLITAIATITDDDHELDDAEHRAHDRRRRSDEHRTPPGPRVIDGAAPRDRRRAARRPGNRSSIA